MIIIKRENTERSVTMVFRYSVYFVPSFVNSLTAIAFNPKSTITKKRAGQACIILKAPNPSLPYDRVITITISIVIVILTIFPIS